MFFCANYKSEETRRESEGWSLAHASGYLCGFAACRSPYNKEKSHDFISK
jgi:hypothetical protein